MGDTKRGRERKGKIKREQLRRREISETLSADEEPPELDELVPEPEDEEIDTDAEE